MVDGIVYLTEDRKVEDFFEEMPIAETTHVERLVRKSPFVVSGGEMVGLAQAWRTNGRLTRMRVSSNFPEDQPKAVIAKALMQRPQQVIFEEPARGVEFAPDPATEKKILYAAMPRRGGSRPNFATAATPR